MRVWKPEDNLRVSKTWAWDPSRICSGGGPEISGVHRSPPHQCWKQTCGAPRLAFFFLSGCSRDQIQVLTNWVISPALYFQFMILKHIQLLIPKEIILLWHKISVQFLILKTSFSSFLLKLSLEREPKICWDTIIIVLGGMKAGRSGVQVQPWIHWFSKIQRSKKGKTKKGSSKALKMLAIEADNPSSLSRIEAAESPGSSEASLEHVAQGMKKEKSWLRKKDEEWKKVRISDLWHSQIHHGTYTAVLTRVHMHVYIYTIKK